MERRGTGGDKRTRIDERKRPKQLTGAALRPFSSFVFLAPSKNRREATKSAAVLDVATVWTYQKFFLMFVLIKII